MRLQGNFRSRKFLSIRRFNATAKEEHGQALIETALVMPLLFLILLGVAEFSMASYAAIEVSNAALAGAQYGAQNPAYAADTAGIRAAAQNDAGNITLGTTTATESCTCSGGTGGVVSCLPTSCSGSNIETILTVQTQAPFNSAFHYLGLPAAFTLHGLASQKVLQ